MAGRGAPLREGNRIITGNPANARTPLARLGVDRVRAGPLTRNDRQERGFLCERLQTDASGPLRPRPASLEMSAERVLRPYVPRRARGPRLLVAAGRRSLLGAARLLTLRNVQPNQAFRPRNIRSQRRVPLRQNHLRGPTREAMFRVCRKTPYGGPAYALGYAIRIRAYR